MKPHRTLVRLFVDDLPLACSAMLVPALCWAALRGGLSPRLAGLLLFSGLAAALAGSIARARDRLSHNTTRDRA